PSERQTLNGEWSGAAAAFAQRPLCLSGVAIIAPGGERSIVCWRIDLVKKKVVVLPGDDTAPETVYAAMEVMRALEVSIDFVEFPPGEQWVRGETDKAARAAIDASDSTLFGSTSGKTTSVGYLRWGKRTY